MLAYKDLVEGMADCAKSTCCLLSEFLFIPLIHSLELALSVAVHC